MLLTHVQRKLLMLLTHYYQHHKLVQRKLLMLLTHYYQHHKLEHRKLLFAHPILPTPQTGAENPNLLTHYYQPPQESYWPTHN